MRTKLRTRALAKEGGNGERHYLIFQLSTRQLQKEREPSPSLLTVGIKFNRFSSEMWD